MRSATASLLGRLMAQPLHGPRVALLVGRALPARPRRRAGGRPRRRRPHGGALA